MQKRNQRILKINPSVITCDSVGTRTTNLVDSTENKLNESIVVNEKDTFNISSNNLTSTDVDTSIIKLTNQMKKNFLLARQDFDTYLKKNLSGKTQATPLDSITTKESQIKELLKDPITFLNH